MTIDDVERLIAIARKCRELMDEAGHVPWEFDYGTGYAFDADGNVIAKAVCKEGNDACIFLVCARQGWPEACRLGLDALVGSLTVAIDFAEFAEQHLEAGFTIESMESSLDELKRLASTTRKLLADWPEDPQ